MFLRRKTKSARGVGYSYWHLCRTVRTARGPRQQVVASLGKLDESEQAALRGGWDDLPGLLRGETPPPRVVTAPLPGLGSPTEADSGSSSAMANPASRWEPADLRALRVERSRDFGECYLALSLWHRLGLDALLAELLPAGREQVGWAHTAALLTVARFCAQRSELGVAEHWYETTALDDLLGVDPASVNDDRLYRALDQLGAHKDALCAHLMTRYRDWFGVRFEFLLYDVTSTYFEGLAEKNTKAARGYSRDQRSDCKQVCIGLVCTPEGLPLNFEVFAGNRADVTTVEDIVRKMEDRFGQAERIWVMDRGMVSEANIEFLRQRKALYIVGTPKSQLRAYEAELAEKENWIEVENGVEARLVDHPDGKGQERYVLCRSSARGAKERAMLERQMNNLTEEMIKIDRSLRRRAQSDLEKIGRRIGRWQGKYPAAARLLEIELIKDNKGCARALRLSCPLREGEHPLLTKGAYLLRTNCTETDPAKLWRWYIQLTQAEAAFRTVKSDLGLRPIYHQKTERVEAHLLVCFLSLALWRSLEMWMRSKGLGSSARKLVAAFSTVRSMDVTVPVKRAERTITLRLRTVAKPDPDVALLLAHLGLHLPKGSKLIQNVAEKIA